jgi:type IV pilus assembly protein PilE
MTVKYRKARGFTLLELMITVGIIGILAALAYPQYTSRVIATRRGDGAGTLMRVMQSQERFFINNLTYTTDLTNIGYSAASAADSPEGFYKITATACVSSTIAQCVQLTAVPQGSQAGDGSLSLNSRGGKTGNWP